MLGGDKRSATGGDGGVCRLLDPIPVNPFLSPSPPPAPLLACLFYYQHYQYLGACSPGWLRTVPSLLPICSSFYLPQ